MQQFSNVLRELRIWLTAYHWVNFLLPWSLYLMFGCLGIMFLNDILQAFHIYLSFLSSLLTTIGYFGFIIGSLCCLITADIKYVPYGFWGYAFLALFPFTYISIYAVVKAAIWIYLGYLLIKYTAIHGTDITL